MGLTKQDLEQVLDKRFNAFEKVVDNKFIAFGQKMDEKLDAKLGAQTKELKAYSDEQTEHLALIIAETVAIPLQELKTNFESHVSPALPHKNIINRL